MSSISFISLLKECLKKHCKTKQSVLLGLSGGPDSLALFYGLIELKKGSELEFAVAHIDHRWRKESSAEAIHLQQLALTHDVPFHLKVLDPSLLKGNLESACRDERLNFFKKLCSDFDHQAVVLGHHQDDRAETVLKRIFEGSGLPNIGGLSLHSVNDGLTILRPLITMSKSEIGKWLEERNISAFEDSTNLDVKYLRGRFRAVLIPYLAKEFGKEIAAPLNRLADEAQELKEHLDVALKPYLANTGHDASGVYLDLSVMRPASLFELKHLLRRFCQQEGICLNHAVLGEMCRFLLDGDFNKRFIIKKKTMIVDRKRLFIQANEKQDMKDRAADER